MVRTRVGRRSLNGRSCCRQCMDMSVRTLVYFVGFWYEDSVYVVLTGELFVDSNVPLELARLVMVVCADGASESVGALAM